MKRISLRIGVALVLALISTASAQVINVMQHIRYEIVKSKTGEASPAKNKSSTRLVGWSIATMELEFPGRLEIKWDRDGLLQELAQGVASTDPRLIERINKLGEIVSKVLEIQTWFIRVKTVAIQLETARAAKNTVQVNALDATFIAVNDTFGKTGEAALKALQQSMQADPELNLALRNPVNEALLQGVDYTPVAHAVADYLQQQHEALAEQIGVSVEQLVFMRAYLMSQQGRIRLHLDGYDNIPEGQPLPESQIFDQRAQLELKSATKLGEAVKDVVSDQFVPEVKKAFEQLQASLRELSQILQTEVLDAQLESLINDLQLAADQALGPLIRSLKETHKLLISLRNLPKVDDAPSLEQIVAVLNSVSGRVNLIGKALQQLPDSLQSYIVQAEKLLREKPEVIQEETVNKFKEAAQAFLKNENIASMKKIYANLRDIVKALQAAEGIAGAVVDEKPHRIQESLDTALNVLATDLVEMHVGDVIQIEVEVVSTPANAAGGTVDRHLERQNFRLQKYGLYREARGGLIFVDPRAKIKREIEFTPVPALSINWLLGIKNFYLWNRLLAPSFGVSFALLDFDDAKEIENGLAVNASLFRNFAWVGYGRNLQVKADYFYLGFNLHGLANLLRL